MPTHLHIVYCFFCIQLQSWVVVKVANIACKAKILMWGLLRKNLPTSDLILKHSRKCYWFLNAFSGKDEFPLIEVPVHPLQDTVALVMACSPDTFTL